ncbi:MAG: hypothetical protein HGB06_05865 [Chlorobaculum sp.]|jgi:hypothetical protein|nr:hypothetical protein [Chlorobaculum sp.]
MAPVLDDLLNDERLARLFSKESRNCALQLWILQIKSTQSIENRVVYGRLLPYSYARNNWSASENDNFHSFGEVHAVGEVQAQLVRLNLYVKSHHCADILRQLSAGQTISAMSEDLNLVLSPNLKTRFGATTLAADNLAYRPVAYLINRDAYDRRSPSSPHGGGGAFSASITQSDKGALFRLGQDYDVALTESVIQQINADTGLDFGAVDAVRFGDLELLVFPSLDDQEHPLLNVSWADDPLALVARFNPQQVPYFSAFLFRLCIMNDGQVIYSGIAASERNAEGVFECKFEVNDQLRAMTDSTELEVFGFRDEHSREGTLCCRWRIGYVREIHTQGHAVGHGASPVKFDWLEKTVPKSVLPRAKAALTINRDNPGFTNHISTREAETWVTANREIVSLFARLHPPKSDGRFYLRWSKDDPESRQKFTEWFRALLNKYRQHQVIIFDPYFEDAGLRLLLICAADNTGVIVFRSLPKSSKSSEGRSCESDKPMPSGVDNLRADCEHNRHLLKRIKLQIYGLKEGRLHDRYILIVGADGLPAAGFHLSNSFQLAAENYPLLVTPIPADTLLQVEQYKYELVKEARDTLSAGETKNPAMELLFDSTASQEVQRHYEPLHFLEKAHAGDVLSVLTGESSLQGLNGEALKERMVAVSLFKDNSLELLETISLHNCLERQHGYFSDFKATWEVLGEVLAHSSMGDNRFNEIESEHGFLKFLAQFLDTSFNRTNDELDKELAVIDSQLFRTPAEDLLHSSYHPDHLFHPTKYAALTWSEYYTIKFLWWYAPDALLKIAENQMRNVPEEPQGVDVVRLSLMSQIVSEISCSVVFDISELQRNLLIHSRNGLLKWMGLNAIEMQQEKPGGLAAVQLSVSAFSSPEQVQVLGWMVHRAARNPKKAEIFKGLIGVLHEALPTKISAEELRSLIDSMRGHMRQLAWAEPWLFQDVIYPLLRNEHASTDDACEIWVQELASLLGLQQKPQPRLFERAREGRMTNVTSFLFADSSSERQLASLKSLQEILKKQKRIVQQPLASTSDWTRWNEALVVSMWILAFTRWGVYYLQEHNIVTPELEELSREARNLAMVRPMVEWRCSKVKGSWSELAAFFDQAEELLASSGQSS